MTALTDVPIRHQLPGHLITLTWLVVEIIRLLFCLQVPKDQGVAPVNGAIILNT